MYYVLTELDVIDRIIVLRQALRPATAVIDPCRSDDGRRFRPQLGGTGDVGQCGQSSPALNRQNDALLAGSLRLGVASFETDPRAMATPFPLCGQERA